MSSKFYQLLVGLHERSHHNDVEWVETMEDDVFRSRLGKASVVIARTVVGEKRIYTAVLENREGNTVDEIIVDNGRTVDEWGELSDVDDRFPLLEELYAMARASARNRDSLLDDLLKDFGPE